MIVKNEARIIRRCLTHALPLIDHVLVIDTGSTDGTQDIIRNFLRENNLPGLVIDEPWRDFAYNRSFAMARLREVSHIDYGFMIDADNILHFENDFDSAAFKAGLTKDYYSFLMKTGALSYNMPWLFSNRFPFRFRGVLHEFLEVPPGLNGDTAHGFVCEQIQDSARNQDPHKYLADVMVLEKALLVEKDAFMVGRYTFYLAQSYKDADLPQRAMECYLRAASLMAWQEEVFISLYEAANLMRQLGHADAEVLQAYKTAYHSQPGRAEALHGAASFCREKGLYPLGYQLAKDGLKIPQPEPGICLFVQDWIYQYGLLDEYAVHAYWCQHYAECERACLEILNHPALPESERPRILANLTFAREKMANVQGSSSAKPGNSPGQQLAAILLPQRITHIVDVGANPVDGHPPYHPMLLEGICHITGFEPQADALEELRSHQGPHETYLPYAVGDGQEHELHICHASGMTSFLEPDVERLALFSPFELWGKVTAKIPMQTRRLDDIQEIEHLDFLKIDIQGGELDVFRNGIEKLSSTVVIHVEVSFVGLYRNQPGFGEIDVELRRQGFLPHGLAAVKHWPLVPWRSGASVAPEMSQLLEADLVYVRDITRPDGLAEEQLKHLALIAHHCYRSYDLALRCIVLLEKRSAVHAGAGAAYERLLGIHPAGPAKS